MIKSRIRWAEHMACRKKMRNVEKSLVGICQGRLRHRWKDNNKMDLEKRCGDMI
jgi:hypothetical protein